jgi:hypothetical protein
VEVDVGFLPTDGGRGPVVQPVSAEVFECVVTTLTGCSDVIHVPWGSESTDGSL